MMYRWIKTRFYALLVMGTLAFVLTTGNAALADKPLTYCPDGMLSYWKLDETISGKYIDSYGGNDGLCGEECPVASDTGIIGGGQLFDGENTKINVPADATLNWGINDSFSIEFWMRRLPPPPDSGSYNNEVIVGRDDDDKTNLLHWWVGVHNESGYACFMLKDSSGETTGYLVDDTNLADDVWHHVVAVRNAIEDQIFLYVDGELADSTDKIYTDGFASPTAPLNIGHLLGSYHFSGMIDEVVLYNKALSLEEIQQHYYNVIIVEYLYALLPTNDENVDKEINKAIEYIQKNLTLCKNVPKVFEDSKKAVKALMNVADPDISNTIATLVSMNERLARTAIDQAIAEALATGCYENDNDDSECHKALKKIAEAEREMVKAQDNYDMGKYDKAIDHYKKACTKVKAHPKTHKEDVLRIMPLGNSITLGYNGNNSDLGGYRSNLETGLLSEDYAFDFVGSLNHGPSGFDNDHEGHGGWHADEIAFSIYQWLKDNPAEVVLLHIGTNDISGGQAPKDIAEEIDLILDRIDRYEKGTHTDIIVILARIINQKEPIQNIIDLNSAIQDLADAREDDNIIVVDMENALDYPDDMSTNPDDKVHPNDAGYAKMADVWLDAIVTLQLSEKSK
ncbi:MAG: GDSL-type esterase/lipase family protein [Deltaproteobacteria bacterium]|jgi:lysophospholipase L1-like esterase|nr:GDSL-type esterase/lipase family protein [Deltaproteobacteria bacterium]